MTSLADETAAESWSLLRDVQELARAPPLFSAKPGRGSDRGSSFPGGGQEGDADQRLRRPRWTRGVKDKWLSAEGGRWDLDAIRYRGVSQPPKADIRNPRPTVFLRVSVSVCAQS